MAINADILFPMMEIGSEFSKLVCVVGAEKMFHTENVTSLCFRVFLLRASKRSVFQSLLC